MLFKKSKFLLSIIAMGGGSITGFIATIMLFCGFSTPWAFAFLVVSAVLSSLIVFEITDLIRPDDDNELFSYLWCTGYFAGAAIFLYLIDAHSLEFSAFLALALEIACAASYVYAVSRRAKTFGRKEECTEKPSEAKNITTTELTPKTDFLELNDLEEGMDKYADLFNYLSIEKLNSELLKLKSDVDALSELNNLPNHKYYLSNDKIICCIFDNSPARRFAYIQNGKIFTGKTGTILPISTFSKVGIPDCKLEALFKDATREARLKARVAETILFNKIKDSMELEKVSDLASFDISSELYGNSDVVTSEYDSFVPIQVGIILPFFTETK